jgi:hypothetical protein
LTRRRIWRPERAAAPAVPGSPTTRAEAKTAPWRRRICRRSRAVPPSEADPAGAGPAAPRSGAGSGLLLPLLFLLCRRRRQDPSPFLPSLLATRGDDRLRARRGPRNRPPKARRGDRPDESRRGGVGPNLRQSRDDPRRHRQHGSARRAGGRWCRPHDRTRRTRTRRSCPVLVAGGVWQGEMDGSSSACGTLPGLLPHRTILRYEGLQEEDGGGALQSKGDGEWAARCDRRRPPAFRLS